VLIPKSYPLLLLFLLIALVCFSWWPMLYRRSRRRFELFSLDFALGALTLALLAAYTFGTLGPELSFSDRMLVAGRSASGWMFAGGFVFAFGNMLLLAAASLLGLAASFSISLGMALLSIALLHFSPRAAAFEIAVVLLLAAITIAWRAALAVRIVRPGPSAAKGMLLAVFGGLVLAGAQWVFRRTIDPEFGPGPYAQTLMFSLGMLLATPLANFFFMKIKIVGNPITYQQYLAGGLRPHLPGILGGALLAVGMLGALFPVSILTDAGPGPLAAFLLPALAIPVTILIGLFRWHEFQQKAPRARALLLASALCVTAGEVAIGVGLIR
jgi:glucose uptake protein